MSGALAPLAGAQALADLAVLSLDSPHSRRVYSMHLRRYIATASELSRESVLRYLDWMREHAKRASTQNQALAAIRLLVREAECRGLIPAQEAAAIRDIPVAKVKGVRAGHWLRPEQVQAILKLPDPATFNGRRDLALLALLLGTGIRRAEASSLAWASLQEREGRLCIVDLLGKGKRIRTIPVPDWSAEPLMRWREDPSRPQLARPDLVFGGLTDSGVYYVVRLYLAKMGMHGAPHDLRRTIARMLYRASGQLDQVQLVLGHASIATTQRYLGADLKLAKGEAAIDKVRIEGEPQ